MSAQKQKLSHEDFLRLKEKASTFTPGYVDEIISKAMARIVSFKREHPRLAYAWSGGKDSLALQYVCEQAGITECCLGITNLEYPAFLRWVTVNMPMGLTVVNTGLDLTWIQKHPEMLFPQVSSIAAKWFAQVQHKAQARYYKDQKLDGIILGRRLSDGNFVGRDGQYWYTKESVCRVSPIYDWSHEDVFAVMLRAGYPEPPFYSWPRGYRCGTHPWAARQWTGSIRNGWLEVYNIDSSIVTLAAEHIPSAATFLQSL